MKRSFSVVKSSKSQGASKKRKVDTSKRSAYTRKRSSTLSKENFGHPFPAVKKTVMTYENELTQVGTTGALQAAQIACNSMYDLDRSGTVYGNKQPLYYDTLLTASGPYRRYRVTSWRTTYTLVNMTAVPVTIWVLPPTTSTTEIDSAAEADNFPGVKRVYLSAKDGSKNMDTITVTGNIWDAIPLFADSDNAQGTYASDPASVVYGGILAHTSDGTTVANVYVAIKHEMDVELSELDALVS